MEIKRSKTWWLRMSELEGDQPIAAGPLARDPEEIDEMINPLNDLPDHLTLAEVRDLLTAPLFLWSDESRRSCPDDMTAGRFRHLLSEGCARLEMVVTQPDGTVVHLPVPPP